MLYYERGSEKETLSDQDLKEGLYTALDRLGPRRKVLVIPPDFTRFHSRAGVLTRFAWQYYGDSLSAILPALGTHSPMTAEQLGTMFGDIPPELFREHDWRNDVVTIGQNGELRRSFLRGHQCLFLRLNGQGDDLCSFFFVPGPVFFQLTELVLPATSIDGVKEHQDDH